MDELSAVEFSRLSQAEKDAYLTALLGEEGSSDNISSNVQVMRHFTSKLAIESMLYKPGIMNDVPSSSGSTQQRDASGRKKVVGSCYICQADPAKKRRKTRKYCQKCLKPICDEHAITLTRCGHCPPVC